MQRWEYRVVSLRDGSYTDTLNQYGREGWELVAVAPSDSAGPAPERGGGLPMPRAFGRLEDAAAKLNQFGGSDAAESDAPATTLLWVLRRPLTEEWED